MKGLAAGLLLFSASTAFAQAPDGRDSVIIESKTVAPGLSGHPAFTLKVYITNKDTLASFTLPTEMESIAGSAFVVLDTPRTFAGTINRLTTTLNQNLTFSDFTNDISPDSAIWAAFWNPNNRTTAERPNATRKAFWEIRFGRTASFTGQVQIDSADIFDNRAGFVDVDGNSVGVNFVRGIVGVTFPQSCFDQFGPCPPGGLGTVRFGRAFTLDFNSVCPGVWSIVSGPGTIDSNSGVYRFFGRCSLGNIPVIVRLTDTTGGINDCAFELNVIDNAPSCSPAQNTITVSHGQTATNQINASDPDGGDGPVFTKLSGPGAINSSGVWAYITSCSDVGLSPRLIQIKTSDAFDSCNPGPLADTCQFQLMVTNEAPSITNCPTDVVPVDTGVVFSLQLTGSDADPADFGNLQFSLVSGPAGLTVTSSGLVHWMPVGPQWGLQSATVQVRDLCGTTTNCQINFAVSVQKGDLNADGRLSPTDFVYLLACIYQVVSPPVGAWACDLNCDGQGTGLDVALELFAVFAGRDFPC